MTDTIKQIGTVILDYPLWVKEYLAMRNMLGEKRTSTAGTAILYEAEIHTPTRTLTSRESGWLSEQNIADLKTLWNQMDTSFDIIYSDDSTETVVFDRSIPMNFTDVYEGACDYTANISLIKVSP